MKKVIRTILLIFLLGILSSCGGSGSSGSSIEAFSDDIPVWGEELEDTTIEEVGYETDEVKSGPGFIRIVFTIPELLDGELQYENSAENSLVITSALIYVINPDDVDSFDTELLDNNTTLRMSFLDIDNEVLGYIDIDLLDNKTLFTITL